MDAVSSTYGLAHCAHCGEHGYVIPLHGARGGPMCCMLCIGKWEAKHRPIQRARRVLIKALKAYDAVGGNMHGEDFNKLKLAVSLGDTPVDFSDLTTELLTATLALTHPDKHPPERKVEAQRVTQELLALKPFVFPAPQPEPPPKPEPRPKKNDDLSKRLNESLSKLYDYPCEDCRDAVPMDYCTACRAEWEKRQQKEFEVRTAKQRAEYAQRRADILARRPETICPVCRKQFTAKRSDARFCSDRCRQKAHRQAPITAKSSNQRVTIFNRDSWRRGILALLDRHSAVYLNDLLPANRTNAEYQKLCRVVAGLEDHGEIETTSYWVRCGYPGHKALIKPGHEIERPDIVLLEDHERLQTAGPEQERTIPHINRIRQRLDQARQPLGSVR
jgi:hypothetical protein